MPRSVFFLPRWPGHRNFLVLVRVLLFPSGTSPTWSSEWIFCMILNEKRLSQAKVLLRQSVSLKEIKNKLVLFSVSGSLESPSNSSSNPFRRLSLLSSLVLIVLTFLLFCPQPLMTSIALCVLYQSWTLRVCQPPSPKHHPSLRGCRHRASFATHVTRVWQGEGHKVRKGWVCGLKQPLVFIHINNDTGFFLLLQKDSISIY